MIMNIENDYNFLIMCNNYILNILKAADKLKWSEAKIDFKPKDIKKAKDGAHDLFYFRNHGYAKVINPCLYRHIIFSLISDYNKYVYDAIECAQKMHFGPAFTLLRKPFKDNLLLIEKFYIEGYKCIPSFFNNDISKLAIDHIKPDDKKKILKKCSKKIRFLNEDYLWAIRYSNKDKISLEKLWNKTLHIITTREDYSTEQGNLNIIFADDETIKENLIYFYKACVPIQMYFILLVLNIIKKENLISDYEFYNSINSFYHIFIAVLDEEIPESIANTFLLWCDKCDNTFKISEEEKFNYNFEKNVFEFTCPYCHKKHRIGKFGC